MIDLDQFPSKEYWVDRKAVPKKRVPDLYGLCCTVGIVPHIDAAKMDPGPGARIYIKTKGEEFHPIYRYALFSYDPKAADRFQLEAKGQLFEELSGLESYVAENLPDSRLFLERSENVPELFFCGGKVLSLRDDHIHATGYLFYKLGQVWTPEEK